jgi:hypothetical protein
MLFSKNGKACVDAERSGDDHKGLQGLILGVLHCRSMLNSTLVVAMVHSATCKFRASIAV